ncbi:MAG: hypothetical protein RSB76_02655, partial [Clostridia bacterium]
MNLLEECLKQNISFNEILNLVVTNDKKYSLDLLGLTDIAKAQMVHSLTKNTNKSSIVICSNVVECQKMMQDLKFLSDVEVIYFPARNIEYYDIEAESKEVINQRMYAIEKILSKKINIVVTTIDAILVKMFPFNSYGDLDIEIKIGDLLQTNDFVKTLIKLGYERCELVEGKGQFALRGGIIDIFTLNSEFPFRIELFGNNVDTIRTFDSLTQRSSDTLKKVKISYVSE